MRHIRSKHSFIQPYPVNTSMQYPAHPNTTPSQVTVSHPPTHTPPPPLRPPPHIPPLPLPPHTPPTPLNVAPPPPPTKVVLQQHPFTMIMYGTTSGGKSYWMNNILERARQMIIPPPQRIIWSYRRWQHLFNDMQRNIRNIVFVKGIPEQLNGDSFVDPRYTSVIVIKDVMGAICGRKPS